MLKYCLSSNHPSCRPVDVLAGGRPALEKGIEHWDWRLQTMKLTIWSKASNHGQNPVDVELMMFAQANSEHSAIKSLMPLDY